MHTATINCVERAELPSMAATLCCYENLFGPYHPQTLRFMAEVAGAHWYHGELARAPALFERAVRDVGRHLGRGHDVRLRALIRLRDLLIEQREYENAGTVQRELLECCVERFGTDHRDTLSARAELATILLRAVVPALNKEV
jgi:hypothetical protein